MQHQNFETMTIAMPHLMPNVRKVIYSFVAGGGGGGSQLPEVENKNTEYLVEFDF